MGLYPFHPRNPWLEIFCQTKAGHRPALPVNPPAMKFVTRRWFLKTSALTGAGAVFSARSWSQVAGANAGIRLAIAGMNGHSEELTGCDIARQKNQ